MNPTSYRIANKLGLINIITSNKGVSFESLVGVSNHERPAKIKKELGQLFMVGSHPYTPADYIEVDYDSTGIKISLPVNIERAIGLNAREWVQLRNLIECELAESESEEDRKIYESIKSKIQKVVPSSEYRDFQSLKELVREAIAADLAIAFTYQKRNSNEMEERIVDPCFFFEEKSQYLAAYCHSGKGIRSFRLDLIQNLRITDIRIQYHIKEETRKEHLDSFLAFLSRSEKDSDLALLRVDSSAYFHLSGVIRPEEVTRESPDSYLMKTKIIEMGWFLSLIKGYGSSVSILEPNYLKQELSRQIAEIRIPGLLT
ncbi:MAG: WYL domain-containing protein [Leptospiraceae bacterium]|nr:WYL domain-containing protein [Leptospiraceae bacterium]MCP5510250.1 WYL domain-containing protein [Leptospiraceae bacterium]